MRRDVPLDHFDVFFFSLTTVPGPPRNLDVDFSPRDCRVAFLRWALPAEDERNGETLLLTLQHRKEASPTLAAACCLQKLQILCGLIIFFHNRNHPWV